VPICKSKKSVMKLANSIRLTMHNVHYLLSLMGLARQAIIEDRYPQFLISYFKQIYREKSNYPQWAVTALQGVGVDLLANNIE
jgi:queuine tRNA-ribosyltransferase catalytic subunit